MRTIEAYQSADGELHLCEKKAKARDEDILGEALDGLLRLFEIDISRSQQHKGIISVMKNRAALAQSVSDITRVLEHVDKNED